MEGIDKLLKAALRIDALLESVPMNINRKQHDLIKKDCSDIISFIKHHKEGNKK